MEAMNRQAHRGRPQRRRMRDCRARPSLVWTWRTPWFVTAFALVWMVFIAALLRFGRIALPAILIVAVVAMVLDVGDVVRQVGEAKSLLATIAVLVTVSHVALAVLTLLVLLQGMRPRAVQFG